MLAILLYIQKLKFKRILYYKMHHPSDNNFESNQSSLCCAQTLNLMYTSVAPDLLNKNYIKNRR